jgi:hypothetical protein
MAMMKKRKVDSECRNFQERWTETYFFIEYKRKPVCLICLDSVSEFKDCNLKRHNTQNLLKNMRIYRGRQEKTQFQI